MRFTPGSFRSCVVPGALFALLSLAGCDPEALGGLPYRLTPERVDDGAGDADGATAWVLFDRDTVTRFRAGEGATLTVHLGGGTPVHAVKVFGTAPYSLGLPGGATIDLAEGTADGWNLHPLEEPIALADVPLVLTAHGEPGEVGDIELWGLAPAAAVTYAPPVDGEAEGDRPANVDVVAATPEVLPLGPAGEADACGSVRFELERHPGAYRRMWVRMTIDGAFRPFALVRAFNEHAMVRGTFVPSDSGARYVQPIDPELLALGTNEAHFCLPDASDEAVTVSNVEIVGELDHGSNVIESATVAPYDADPTRSAIELLAGSAVTLGANEELVLAFDRLESVDGIAIDSAEPSSWTMRCVAEDGSRSVIELAAPEPAEAEAATGMFEVTSGGKRCAGMRIGRQAGGTIAAVRVFGSGAARRIDFPQIVLASAREHFGYQAWAEGWVRAPSDVGGGASLSIDGGASESASEGIFGRMLTRSTGIENAWIVTVAARFANGETSSRSFILDGHAGLLPGSHGIEDVYDDGLSDHEREARYGRAGQVAERAFRSGESGRVALGTHVGVDIPEGAIQGSTTISLKQLTATEVPPLDPGMINVTAPFARGFEFLPHGTQFDAAVTVTLPYQPNLVPDGYTVHDIETWYYDEGLDRWSRLARDEVDPRNGTVKSLTDHFTVMINAIVVTPEHPQASSFDGNRIRGLEAAHPGAGITMIEPPTANNRGDANLQYPLVVPPGRRGAQPELALTYSSSGGNGWVGVGWNVPISSISVDSRFGVPRYSLLGDPPRDSGLETETYLLDGEQLAPTAHRAEFRTRTSGPTRFWRRAEQDFERIVRYGTNPKNYYWVVTAKDGTKRFYGRSDLDPVGAGVRQPAAIGAADGIFRWYLRETLDTFGNRVRYEYELLGGEGPNDRRSLVLAAIHYTVVGTEAGTYQVHFCRDAGDRPDPVLSARGGFLEHTTTRLERVEVHYDPAQDAVCRDDVASSFVRGWQLAYHATSGDPAAGYVDPFGKSRLASIQQLGIGGAFFEGARHDFTYHDDVRGDDTSYEGFATGVPSDEVDDPGTAPIASTIIGGIGRRITGDDDMDLPEGAVNSSVLGGSRTIEGTGGVYIGINPFSPWKTLSGGISINTSFAQTTGLASLYDVDGDGLPDHVVCNRTSCSYNRNLGANGRKIEFSDLLLPLDGMTGINREQAFSIGVGPQLNAGAQLFYNFGVNVATTRVYVADVNGDGIPDQVEGGDVRFGYYDRTDPDVSLEEAPIAFSLSSGNSPVQLGARSTAALGDEDLDELEDLVRDMTPAEDAMRLWRAPYDGHVRVRGSVALTTAPEAPDDGVLALVEVARAASESVESLFVATLGPDGATSAEPELELDVSAGDHIVFRVNSREDGLHDEVAWAPTITYTDLPFSRDVAGFDVRRYSSAQDFVPFGSGHTIALPYSGTVRITGSLEKLGATNDGVWLEVLENDDVIWRRWMARNDVGPVNLSFDHTVEVDPADTLLDTEEAADAFRTSTLTVRLASRVPVDLRRFRATEDFEVMYLDATDGETPVPTVGDDGEALLKLKVQLDARTLVPARSGGGPVAPVPAVTFAAEPAEEGEPQATERRVVVRFQALSVDELPQDFWLTATIDGRVAFAQGLTTEPYVLPEPPAWPEPPDWTAVTSTWELPVDRPISFAVSGSRASSWQIAWATLSYRYDDEPESAFRPLSFQAFAAGEAAPYSAPYRGFRAGSIRAGDDPGTLTWLELFGKSACTSELEGLSRRQARRRARRMRDQLSQDAEETNPEPTPEHDEEDPYVVESGDAESGQRCEDTGSMSNSPEARRGSMRAVQLGDGCPEDPFAELDEEVEGVEAPDSPDELRCPPLDPPHFRGLDDRVYLTGTTMSASRLGPDRLPIDRTGPIVVGDDTPDGRGRGVVRLGNTITNSFGGGIFGASASLGRSASRSMIDFRDLNGDGLPDLLRPGRVKYTTPIGRLEGFRDVPFTCGEGEDASTCNRRPRTSSVTGAMGYGATPVGQRGNGRAQEGGTGPGGQPGNANNDPGWGSFNFSAGLNAGISRNNWELMDVNGDGLPDRLRVAHDGHLQAESLHVQLNLGYRFAPEEEWGAADIHRSMNYELNAGVGYTSPDQGWNIGISGSMSRSQVRRPNPAVTAAVVPAPMLPFFLAEHSTLLDVNADGLVDVVRPGEEGLWVRFNNGAGFAAEEIFWGGGNQTSKFSMVEVSELDTFTVSANGGFQYGIGPIIFPFNLLYIDIAPSIGVSNSDSRPKVEVQDIDGDGAADHLRSFGPHTVDVALNNTRRTGLLATVRRPMGSSFAIDYEGVGNTRANPEHVWAMSSLVVHDGVADTVAAGDASDYRIQTFAYENGRYDRLEREFLGFGLVRTTELNTRGFAGGAFGGLTAYRTSEQEFHNATVFDKGLPRRTTVRSGSTEIDGVQHATYELRDADEAVQARLDEHGFHEVTVPGSPTVIGSEWLQIVPRTTHQVSYEAGSAEGVATVTSQDVDDLGNVTTFTDAGSLTTSTDDFVATIDYARFGGTTLDDAYIVGVPKSIVVRDLGGHLLRERTSVIDPFTGTPESVTTRLNDDGVANSATTTLRYTSVGQLHEVVSPSGGGADYVLTFGYDDFIGAHVTSVTDSFGLSSTAEFDEHLGLQTRDTDIHGQVVSTMYDAFGRPESITGPYEQGEGVVTIAYDYHPTGPTPWAHTANYDELAPDDPIETFTFADGLGRLLQTKKDGTVFVDQATRGGSRVRIVSGRVQYDPWGRAVKAWYPTTEALGAPGGLMAATLSDVDPMVVTYDAQDRVLSTTLPDGATTTQSYTIDGAGLATLLRTEVVDAEGERRASLRDVRGLIRAVEEHIAVDGVPAVHSTTYDYNPMSELVSVLDAAGNPTTVKYDYAGRRTEIDSPDAGRTVVQYDLGGNVVVRETAALRARNQVIRYVYDRTHLVQVDHPGTEADVVYEWGASTAAASQRGRITRVLDAGGTLEREYGPLGEVVKETRHLYDHTQTAPTLTEIYPEDAPTDAPLADPQGPRLTTRYRYDTWGRLHELVYPDGEVVRYGYDSGGLVRSATGVKLGVEYRYVSRLEYDEFGQRVFQELGNGIISHYTYDEETRRLETLSSGEFQRLVYGYNGVGNVTSLVNDVGPLPADEHGGRAEQSFIYDDLHRLVSASGEWHEPGGARNEYSLSLAYDAIHNLTHKTQENNVYRNGNGHGVLQRRTSYDFAYAYEGPQPHAPSHVGDQSFGYDASGRQVTVTPDQGGPRRTVLWDSEDRIRAIQDGGGAVLDEQENVVAGHGRTTSFTYDHRGQRITKSGAQGHTAYVNQFYTLRNETVATKHVFVGATRVTSKLVPGVSSEQLPTETDDVSRFLGRWWQHRSESGWEHANNVDMNPHYQVPTQMPSPMGLPESNFVYFYHPDHLGSTSYVTDAGGETYEHVQYFPHGDVWADERSNTERLPYLFTGKELDQETGLYDFGARMYDARTGLWVSPDPALPEYVSSVADDIETIESFEHFEIDEQEEAASDSGDFVSWPGIFASHRLNMYSMAGANPINVVDPDGRQDQRVRVAWQWAKNFARSPGVRRAFPRLHRRLRVAERFSDKYARITNRWVERQASQAWEVGRRYASQASDAVSRFFGSDQGQGFRSFRAFKEAMGPAGPDMHWHHIVEQRAGNIARFGANAIHNTRNLVRIDASIHSRISGYYGSIQDFTGGQRVRDWLSSQSFEAQREFGLRVMRQFGVTP